jgi:flagellar FliJ protein
MSNWARSLIKLSTYEVETLQKRLAEIAAARARIELRLAALDAEGRAELAAAATAEPQHAWRIVGYMAALETRKAEIRSQLHVIALEEQGARDALAQAFETQKKYEQVAEQARLLALKADGRRETAQLDELGLRRTGGR